MDKKVIYATTIKKKNFHTLQKNKKKYNNAPTWDLEETFMTCCWWYMLSNNLSLVYKCRKMKLIIKIINVNSPTTCNIPSNVQCKQCKSKSQQGWAREAR